MKTEKEFLYVGYYIDTNGNYILKIGTTNNLERRQSEHTRNYRKGKNFTLAATDQFKYIWWKPLSKYNTLRYEDRTREKWQNMEIGHFIRNDRFMLNSVPEFVEIDIRKTYKIKLAQASFFV